MAAANSFDSAHRLAQFSRMQQMQFEQAIVTILGRDKRFGPHAFFFLKDSLDYTLKRAADGNNGLSRHVTGGELLAGFRDLALEQFGPMASTLMQEWGIRECSDVGEMVFLLIEEQMFGRQESDTKEDFLGNFDLKESLTQPFLPKRFLGNDLSEVSPLWLRK